MVNGFFEDLADLWHRHRHPWPGLGLAEERQLISLKRHEMRTVINNHTKYDTRALTAVVRMALRRAGCKPGVTVILVPSQTQLRGRECGSLWTMHIPSKPYESLNKAIAVEERRRAFAARIYLTAVHESKHAADRQQGNRFGEYNRRWVNRPHEIRAVAMEHAAFADLNAGRAPKAEAAIEALAGTMTWGV